jgi:hypothetical protein
MYSVSGRSLLCCVKPSNHERAVAPFQLLVERSPFDQMSLRTRRRIVSCLQSNLLRQFSLFKSKLDHQVLCFRPAPSVLVFSCHVVPLHELLLAQHHLYPALVASSVMPIKSSAVLLRTISVRFGISIQFPLSYAPGLPQICQLNSIAFEVSISILT